MLRINIPTKTLRFIIENKNVYKFHRFGIINMQRKAKKSTKYIRRAAFVAIFAAMWRSRSQERAKKEKKHTQAKIVFKMIARFFLSNLC